jgi:predicted permease
MVFLFGIGAIFAKINKLDKRELEVLNKFVLNVFVLALFIKATMQAADHIVERWQFFLLVWLLALILMVIGGVYAFIRRYKKDDAITLVVSASLMNCGYLGIPAAMLYGGAELGDLATLFTVAYTPLLVIIPTIIYGEGKLTIGRILKEPFVLSFIAGLILAVVTKYVDLTLLVDTIKVVSKAASPMLLVLLGATFVMLKDWKLNLLTFESTALRIGGGFLAFYIFSHLIGFDSTLDRDIFLLEATMPIGLLPYFICIKQKRNPAQLAGVVIVSTITWCIARIFVF